MQPLSPLLQLCLLPPPFLTYLLLLLQLPQYNNFSCSPTSVSAARTNNDCKEQ